MPHLQIRPAEEQDYPVVERLIIDSFEPITWARTLEEEFGPLNGLNWRARWELRLKKVLTEQMVLLGYAADELAAVSTSTLDTAAALGYIDILAVGRSHQGHGYGREMLRAAMAHLRELGASYVNLDCLTTNDSGNALYESEGFVEVARHIRWFRKL